VTHIVHYFGGYSQCPVHSNSKKGTTQETVHIPFAKNGILVTTLQALNKKGNLPGTTVSLNLVSMLYYEKAPINQPQQRYLFGNKPVYLYI